MLYFIQYFQALTPYALLGYLSPSSCLCPLQNSQFASHADKARVGLCSMKHMVRWGVLKVNKKKNKGPVTDFSSSDLICESSLNTILTQFSKHSPLHFLHKTFISFSFTPWFGPNWSYSHHMPLWTQVSCLPPCVYACRPLLLECCSAPHPACPLRPNPKSHHLKSLAWFLPWCLHTIMLMLTHTYTYLQISTLFELPYHSVMQTILSSLN